MMSLLLLILVLAPALPYILGGTAGTYMLGEAFKKAVPAAVDLTKKVAKVAPLTLGVLARPFITSGRRPSSQVNKSINLNDATTVAARPILPIPRVSNLVVLRAQAIADENQTELETELIAELETELTAENQAQNPDQNNNRNPNRSRKKKKGKLLPDNKNGSLPGRLFWETSGNNFGPLYRWRNVVKVGVPITAIGFPKTTGMVAGVVRKGLGYADTYITDSVPSKFRSGYNIVVPDTSKIRLSTTPPATIPPSKDSTIAEESDTVIPILGEYGKPFNPKNDDWDELY